MNTPKNSSGRSSYDALSLPALKGGVSRAKNDEQEIALNNHELIDQLESLYCLLETLRYAKNSSFTEKEMALIEEQSYILTAQGLSEDYFEELYFNNIHLFRFNQSNPLLKRVFIDVLARTHFILESIHSYFEVRYATLESHDNLLLKKYRGLLKSTLKTSQNYREKLVL